MYGYENPSYFDISLELKNKEFYAKINFKRIPNNN